MPDSIQVPNPPSIPGLVFRHFQGPGDYASLAAVLTLSEQADGLDRQVTAEQIAGSYQHLTNCDPYQDMILAEVDGALVGYARGWWWDETASQRLFGLSGFIVPGWRGRGIGAAMQGWLEERMRLAAAEHPFEGDQLFQLDVRDSQVGKLRLVENAGFRPLRYFYEMARPDLENIPNYPLPDGVELRPVKPEHYPAIWQSVDETSQDEWGYTAPSEEDYQEWLDSPHFQPYLWQVAWDPAANRVVGHVLTFIDDDENQQFGRRRGYTEGLGVDRAWRRRGLARALIARSLQAQKAAGMAESALAADGDSQSNVTKLYESCGFQVVSRSGMYRKAVR